MKTKKWDSFAQFQRDQSICYAHAHQADKLITAEINRRGLQARLTVGVVFTGDIYTRAPYQATFVFPDRLGEDGHTLQVSRDYGYPPGTEELINAALLML